MPKNSLEKIFHMSIFEKETKKTRQTILKNKGKFFFTYNGWPYDLSPSELTKANLPPNVQGVESFLKQASISKKIEGNIELQIEKDWFFCDARIEYKERFMDGWIYNIFGEELQIPIGVGIWICPYIKFFYQEMPDILYLKVYDSALSD